MSFTSVASCNKFLNKPVCIQCVLVTLLPIDEDDANVSCVTDRHQIVQEADHFHTLEICRTLLEDSGEYTMTAQNCLGAVSCHCQLVVDKVYSSKSLILN